MSAASMQTSVIVVGGLSLRVQVQGEGAPVLFLNGLGQPLESWDPFVVALSGRRVIRFDAPGVGESVMPLLPPSMTSLASIAAAVLDEMGETNVDVVGFSLGGAIAQQFAHDYPSRVRHLVLIATSCGLGTTLRRWESGDVLTAPSWGASLTGVFSASWQALAIVNWSSIPFLGGVTQPSLVVSGRHDKVTPPSNGRVLASRIPDARLVILDADHEMLQSPVADELAHVVERFLEETEAPDPAPVEGHPAILHFAINFA
jgi:pimeloyl-ACP methyl ester carboxylesterase